MEALARWWQPLCGVNRSACCSHDSMPFEHQAKTSFKDFLGPTVVDLGEIQFERTPRPRPQHHSQGRSSGRGGDALRMQTAPHSEYAGGHPGRPDVIRPPPRSSSKPAQCTSMPSSGRYDTYYSASPPADIRAPSAVQAARRVGPQQMAPRGSPKGSPSWSASEDLPSPKGPTPQPGPRSECSDPERAD